MSIQIAPFLMFTGDQKGRAAESIDFYLGLFPESKLISMSKYGPGENEPEGYVRHAHFSLRGHDFMAIDSSAPHGFTFTPAISFAVRFDEETTLDEVFARLTDGVNIFMPLDKYPFSKKFGWVGDKFGVSWQLSL